MIKKTIPFFRPTISSETLDKVSEVLKSGWLTTGKITAQFESEFAAYVKSEYAVMLNSCTAALHLSLATLNISKGDEIITTPFTFAATAEVIEYFDATPVFVDIKANDLNIDESKIAAKITSNTKAIIPVHFSGNPCEMDSIINIATEHNLKVIEDAAHCTPAYYKGKPIGSVGDYTCFSFYANKCITTGEGGMVTTNDKAVAEQIKIYRLHGLSATAENRYNEQSTWEYDIQHRGFKYNPTDISAVMGIEQLKQANDFFQKRINIAKKYSDLLEPIENIQIISPEKQNQSSWHIFPIRLKGRYTLLRNSLIEKLGEVGISVSVHFKPLHLHTYYKNKYGYQPDDFPESLDAYKEIISLPIYPGLSIDDIEYIVKNIFNILNSF